MSSLKPSPLDCMREENNRKILIPFLYDFEDGIDLSFGELVAKPFIDDQQVHPSSPSDEALPLLQFQRLAYLQRISTGEITIGELCLYIIEYYDINSELKAATNIVMSLFAEKIADEFYLSKKKGFEMLNEFLSTILVLSLLVSN